MEIIKSKDAMELGARAGKLAAEKIREAIAANGTARIILSTGASQFETLQAMVKEDVDWSKVEMFHLDEYVNISEDQSTSSLTIACRVSNCEAPVDKMMRAVPLAAIASRIFSAASFPALAPNSIASLLFIISMLLLLFIIVYQYFIKSLILTGIPVFIDSFAAMPTMMLINSIYMRRYPF